jgi:hypothetical protein
MRGILARTVLRGGWPGNRLTLLDERGAARPEGEDRGARPKNRYKYTKRRGAGGDPHSRESASVANVRRPRSEVQRAERQLEPEALAP